MGKPAITKGEWLSTENAKFREAFEVAGKNDVPIDDETWDDTLARLDSCNQFHFRARTKALGRVFDLKCEIDELKHSNDELQRKNRALMAEVEELRNRPAAMQVRPTARNKRPAVKPTFTITL